MPDPHRDPRLSILGIGGAGPHVAIFGPHPLLTVTVERSGSAGDEIHFHAGGQGPWVARMAGELGARPLLCAFLGGEVGTVLRPLLDRLPGERRLVPTRAASGCYVIDRRTGERQLVSEAWSAPPSRHELDDLFSVACTAALDSEALVVCNPMPGDSLPLEVYGNLVSDVRANGTEVMVDLSSPRLDSALEGSPDLVKLNDWELAEYVRGPVSDPDELLMAAQQLQAAGAQNVVVTRGGEPGLALLGDEVWELSPPLFERGSREGCGDSMMGAIAAARALGATWHHAVVMGAAAGAANFLRHGLGTGSRHVVEDLSGRIELRPLKRRVEQRAG